MWLFSALFDRFGCSTLTWTNGLSITSRFPACTGLEQDSCPSPKTCNMGQILGTGSAGTSEEVMEEVKTTIQELIKNHKVVVYSKSYCPFCIEVKNLLKSLNMEFTAVELDKEENGATIQETLADITGQRTVPNVFVNGMHIGGCDKTKAAHAEGRLMELYNK